MNTSFRLRGLLWLALASSLLSSGCSSNNSKQVVAEDEFIFEAPENPDKFEAFNRKVFAFNLTMDRWVLKPVAQGYRWVAPQPVEAGVSNFFSNLGEIKNVANDLLQGKWKQAGNDSGRFLLNSTVGIVGLFDVAKHAGLKKSDGEDFGQTLAAWGVPQGPFVMLPFLGPTTVRAGVGLPADWYLSPINEVTPLHSRYAFISADFIQVRASVLELEDLAQGDMYLFVRDAYLQRREYLLNDGNIVDDFGSDDFGDGDFGDVDFNDADFGDGDFDF